MTSGKLVVNGGRCRLDLEDHATGSEIVCAGISGIVWALEGWLALEGEEHAEIVIDDEVRDGNVHLDVVGDDALCTAFEVAGVGLARISQAYPEYLNFEII